VLRVNFDDETYGVMPVHVIQGAFTAAVLSTDAHYLMLIGRNDTVAVKVEMEALRLDSLSLLDPFLSQRILTARPLPGAYV
jgi:hypothetical protein